MAYYYTLPSHKLKYSNENNYKSKEIIPSKLWYTMNDIDDEKMFEIMKNYDQIMFEEEQKQLAKDTSVIEELKKIITEEQFKEIQDFLINCENTADYEIVKKNKVFGSLQKEDYWFKHIYITQHTGYLGDDYNGVIFIPIKKYTFFKFNYWM